MTREQLKKETLEEIEYIKTSNGLTKKDSEAIADLIARQDKYIGELESKLTEKRQAYNKFLNALHSTKFVFSEENPKGVFEMTSDLREALLFIDRLCKQGQ